MVGRSQQCPTRTLYVLHDLHNGVHWFAFLRRRLFVTRAWELCRRFCRDMFGFELWESFIGGLCVCEGSPERPGGSATVDIVRRYLGA